MEKLNEIKHLNAFSIEKSNFIQAEKLNDLNDYILELLDEIEISINNLPNKSDISEFDDKLN